MIKRNQFGQEYGDTMRFFLDGVECTEQEAVAAEDAGTHRVVRGASGIVPEELRQPGETREEWFNPWMELRSING